MQALVSADILRLEAFFAAAGRACIVVHTHPDGDALGSGTALLAYLRQCRGIDAVLLLPDAAPASLDFLLPAEGVVDAARDPEGARARIAACDLLVCLDMNGFGRAEALEAPLRACPAPKVLIDHHLHPERESFSLTFSETEISSASELLYRLLVALPGVGAAERLPLAVLTPLMAGMTTDTNNFSNSVWPSTLQMASELLAAGVDRDALLDALYHRYRENRFRAMGEFLDKQLTITPDGVAYAVLDRDFLRRYDVQDGETEGFVNLPLGIGGVRLSLFLKEDDGHFRVSIRSKAGVSANLLASECFHGGGHTCAAGGKLFFPQDIPAPEAAAEYVATVTARFMRNQSPSHQE
ncbi:MAG: DHH family phosphoesterase [Bacteroidales bacterium]|nr:DHH family phosphoesterase [Bacteroidales bacterium]